MFNMTDAPDEESTDGQIAATLSMLQLTSFFFFLSAYKVHEYSQCLNYDDRVTRYCAGMLQLIMRTFHLNNLESDTIKAPGKTLLAVLPHQTSWDSMALGAVMVGQPPRYYTIKNFLDIPGVGAIMRRFQAIPIEDSTGKDEKAKEKAKQRNRDAEKEAQDILDNDGCVAIFPQGGFAKIGKPPLPVFNGTARLALNTKEPTPIRVVRVSGFWSLENPLIPVSWRNNRMYRFLGTLLQFNRVKVTEEHTITWHIKNSGATTDEKVRHINAELFAFANQNDNQSIKAMIKSGDHLTQWDAKLRDYQEEKAAREAIKAEAPVGASVSH